MCRNTPTSTRFRYHSGDVGEGIENFHSGYRVYPTTMRVSETTKSRPLLSRCIGQRSPQCKDACSKMTEENTYEVQR